jgi:hypothetical protein
VEPNTLLVSYIRKHQARGGKTVLISDMYMHADQIAELLARSGIRPDLYDALYSSADTKVSKASGGIFRPVPRRRAPPMSSMSATACAATTSTPRAAGWRAMLWPIPDALLAERQADHAACMELWRAAPPGPRRGDRGMKTWTPKATDAKRPIWSTTSATTSWGRWCSDGFWPCISTCSSTTTDRPWRYSARARASASQSSTTSSSGRPIRRRAAARMFWVSRSPLRRASSHTPADRNRSIDLLTREYRHLPLRDLVTGLMRQCPDLLSDIDLRDRTLDAHGHNFAGWLTVNGPVQRRVRDFLTGQHRRLRPISTTLLDGRRRALLIDSGWQGTTQSLLTSARPDTDWRGLYFGRILTPEHDRRIVQDCIGLMFEAEHGIPTGLKPPSCATAT